MQSGITFVHLSNLNAQRTCMNAEREEVQVPMPWQPVQQRRKGGSRACTPGTFLSTKMVLNCRTVNAEQQAESMTHPSCILFHVADEIICSCMPASDL